MADSTLWPTWTDDQIASANAYQRSGVMHPFTCGTLDCREDLVAKVDGWHCPTCEYRQNWAHGHMLNWDWLKCDWRKRTKEDFLSTPGESGEE